MPTEHFFFLPPIPFSHLHKTFFISLHNIFKTVRHWAFNSGGLGSLVDWLDSPCLHFLPLGGRDMGMGGWWVGILARVGGEFSPSHSLPHPLLSVQFLLPSLPCALAFGPFCFASLALFVSFIVWWWAFLDFGQLDRTGLWTGTGCSWPSFLWDG